MAADQRRELILNAAVAPFAKTGYHGTSTDTVARAAGVSQPYVVRIFGSKLDLFVAVLDRACAAIDQTFSAVLDAAPFNPDSEADRERLGLSYADLLGDRDLLRVMMHGFAAGDEPEIGRTARAGMATIYLTLRRTGWDEEQVRDFVAQGMLLNVLLSMGALEDDIAGPIADLVRSCLPG